MMFSYISNPIPFFNRKTVFKNHILVFGLILNLSFLLIKSVTEQIPYNKKTKISDKVFEKPEYLSVGEIALKEGVSDRTVRRRLKEKIIPFEKNEGEKAYRIPAEDYYQSLSSEGKSNWFQNHTRE